MFGPPNRGFGFAFGFPKHNGAIIVVTPPPSGGGPPPTGPTLVPLTLSSSTIAENSIPGTQVGRILGLTAGSTPTIPGTAGNKFALAQIGGQWFVVTGSIATNYENATSHIITLQEDLTGATNTGLQTNLLITVGNVLEVTLTPVSGTFSIPENSANGSAVGTPTGFTAGSLRSLLDNAGGRFAMDAAGNITVANGTLLNYEANTSHQVTVREVHPDATITPLDTILTINVSNVFEQPSLVALTLSQTAFTIGSSASGTIIGRAAGSTIGMSGGPSGLTINSTTGTWAYDGSGTAATGTLVLTETLADSANSPRPSNVNWTKATSGTLSVPILSTLSGYVAGSNPPQWQSEYGNPNGYQVWDPVAQTGDKVAARWRVGGGTWTTEADQPLDSAHALADDWEWPLLQLHGQFSSAELAGGALFEVEEQVARFAIVSGVSTEIARTAFAGTGSPYWSDTLTAPPAGVNIQASASQPSGFSGSATIRTWASQTLRAGIGIFGVAGEGGPTGFTINSVVVTPTGGGTAVTCTQVGHNAANSFIGPQDIWITPTALAAGNYDVKVTYSGSATVHHLITAAMNGQSSLTPTDTCTLPFATGQASGTPSDSLTIATNGGGLVFEFDWSIGSFAWNSGFTGIATSTGNNVRRLATSSATNTPAPTHSTGALGMIGVSFPG